MSVDKEEILLKVLVLGAKRVGKTSLLQEDKTPNPNVYKSTVGVDFIAKPIEIGNTTVRLQFWDISGEELGRGIFKAYERDASAVLYVYSEDPEEREKSLREIDQWVNMISLDRSTLVTARVGNKSDRMDKENPQPVLQFDPRFDFDSQVSALTKENVSELFTTLATKLLAKYSAVEEIDSEKNSSQPPASAPTVHKTVPKSTGVQKATPAKSPLQSVSNLDSYKIAIQTFVQNRDQTVPKFQKFSVIREQADSAHDMDEIRQRVKELKDEAAKHRDKGAKWFFKCCWARKTKSLKDLEKVFDTSNHLRMRG